GVETAGWNEAVAGAVKREGDAERRLQMLGEISARLARLRQSVKSGQTAERLASQDQRARIDGILARPEYQPEEERESTIARWIRHMKEFSVRLLRRLLGGSSGRALPSDGGRLFMVLRALIFLVVIVAMIFGAAKL